MVDCCIFVLAQSSQDADYSRLFWPCVVLVVTSIVLFILTWKFVHWWDQALAASRSRRLIFSIPAVIILPLGATICFDLADLSEIAKGIMGSEDPWLLSLAIVFTILFLVGQYVLWHHDDRWNERMDFQEAQTKQSEKNQRFILTVNTSFVNVVGLKSTAIRNLAAEPVTDGCRIDAFRKAIDPESQILRLVMCVHSIFERELKTLDAKLRVCLFHSKDGYLEPYLSWDGKSSDCITTPKSEHRARFKMDSSATECLAVYVAHKMVSEIIPDAEKAHLDGHCPFNYFLASQKEQIKSIAAFVLPRQRSADDSCFVLVLDTDEKGFFKVEDRVLYEHVVSNLACRLHYELNAAKVYQCRKVDLWESLNNNG